MWVSESETVREGSNWQKLGEDTVPAPARAVQRGIIPNTLDFGHSVRRRWSN